MVGVNRFTETAPSAADLGRRRRRGPHRGPGGRARPGRRRGRVAGRRATPAAVERALAELRRVRGQRRRRPTTSWTPTIALARAGGTTGEWADALREVFGDYRAPTGVRAGVGVRGERSPTLVGARSRAIAQRRGAPPQAAGRQARPRRSLQRRRADRGRRARRGLRSRLPGHPALARGDRRRGARRGRRHRRHLDPLGLAPGARAARRRGPARGRRRRQGRRGGHRARRRRARRCAPGGRRGLHAQGLLARPRS